MTDPILAKAALDIAGTQALAEALAPRLSVGDTLLLTGPIGAGKTTFARALIRARLNDPQAEVPSPTFTLVQTYAGPDAPIWHCDLYRLDGPEALVELGLDTALQEAICLIEWPERAGDLWPKEALTIAMAAQAEGHSLTLSGGAPWPARLTDLR